MASWPPGLPQGDQARKTLPHGEARPLSTRASHRKRASREPGFNPQRPARERARRRARAWDDMLEERARELVDRLGLDFDAALEMCLEDDSAKDAAATSQLAAELGVSTAEARALLLENDRAAAASSGGERAPFAAPAASPAPLPPPPTVGEPTAAELASALGMSESEARALVGDVEPARAPPPPAAAYDDDDDEQLVDRRRHAPEARAAESEVEIEVALSAAAWARVEAELVDMAESHECELEVDCRAGSGPSILIHGAADAAELVAKVARSATEPVSADAGGDEASWALLQQMFDEVLERRARFLARPGRGGGGGGRDADIPNFLSLSLAGGAGRASSRVRRRVRARPRRRHRARAPTHARRPPERRLGRRRLVPRALLRGARRGRAPRAALAQPRVGDSRGARCGRARRGRGARPARRSSRSVRPRARERRARVRARHLAERSSELGVVAGCPTRSSLFRWPAARASNTRLTRLGRRPRSPRIPSRPRAKPSTFRSARARRRKMTRRSRIGSRKRSR